MSSLQITALVVATVLVFWAVGAYNRLMRLRNDIVRGFAPVDQQLKLRHTLVQHQIEALAPTLPEQTDRFSALLAACTQAQAALAHARTHPGAAGALNSLRLAEDILLETRARLPVENTTDAGLAESPPQPGAAEAALQFARSRFNDAVAEYNQAVQQFPTRLLAGLFGFRAASPL